MNGLLQLKESIRILEDDREHLLHTIGIQQARISALVRRVCRRSSELEAPPPSARSIVAPPPSPQPWRRVVDALSPLKKKLSSPRLPVVPKGNEDKLQEDRVLRRLSVSIPEECSGSPPLEHVHGGPPFCNNHSHEGKRRGDTDFQALGSPGSPKQVRQCLAKKKCCAFLLKLHAGLCACVLP